MNSAAVAVGGNDSSMKIGDLEIISSEHGVNPFSSDDI